jgi:phosphotransferase system enzyme I (PtsI)
MSARRKRKVLKGLPISSGIALGYARVMLPGDVRVAEVAIPASRVGKEIAALDSAVAQTIEELRECRESAGKKIGGPVAKVFDAQLLIAGDYEFLKKVKEQINRQRRNAGFVYNNLVKETTVPLKRSDDPYIQQMSQDIQAVAGRVLSHLAGYGEAGGRRFTRDTVLVGKSFTPGEILGYRNRKAVGFVVAEGGRNSHMALIARSLITPISLVDDCWREIPNESRIIVDGTKGTVIVDPTERDWDNYQKYRKRQGPAAITRIKRLPDVPPRTADGVPIEIAANLELPGPVDEVLSAQRFPIGLYRTEFLFLEQNRFPSEEEHYQFYDRIAETYANSPVTLRTFDLGADKVGSSTLFFGEDNPALGWRGIRPMLSMSDVFKDQIRAMLRASGHGKFRIMLPMIADVTEVEQARKMISQVMLELRRESIPYDTHIPIGVMIEVPSAALTAEQLARKADFIAIGTNDLTQYTLSADRNNARVAGLYDPLHPSVLHLIKRAVDAGVRRHIPVSICGEVAGDLLAVPLFIGMGVKQLSMNPAKIFDVCRLIRKIDSNFARLLVGSVMSSETTGQVKKKLESYRAALYKKGQRLS